MFILKNKDGKVLPLSAPDEKYAIAMIDISLRHLKECMPDYGKGFDGDLKPVSYEEVGDDDSRYVRSKFAKAKREVLERMDEERIKDMRKESEYEILARRVEDFSLKIIRHFIYLALAVGLTYGVFFLLSMIVPLIIVITLTTVVGLACMTIPVMFLVSIYKFRKRKKERPVETVECHDEGEYDDDGIPIKPDMTVLDSVVETVPLGDYFINKFSLYGTDPYSVACRKEFSVQWPGYMTLRKALIENKDIVFCLNCISPTPILTECEEFNCLNCNTTLKVSDTTLDCRMDNKLIIESYIKSTRGFARETKSSISDMYTRPRLNYTDKYRCKKSRHYYTRVENYKEECDDVISQIRKDLQEKQQRWEEYTEKQNLLSQSSKDDGGHDFSDEPVLEKRTPQELKKVKRDRLRQAEGKLS